jgi:hypothetical protein
LSWSRSAFPSLSEFEVLRKDFEVRLGEFDDAQSEWELVADDKEADDDFEDTAAYRDNVLKGLSGALIRQQELQTPPATPRTLDSCGSSTGSHHGGSKLPKLKLPKFQGDVMEFQSFWDQFCALVHDDQDIPEVMKFTYLKQNLGGEAQSCLQGLAVTADNYQVAARLLQERFGRKERVIFCHLESLLAVPVPANTPAKLWQLLDTLQGHVRSLEVLGIAGDQYGVILTPLLLSRLPEELRLEWSREGEGKEGDLEWLLTFLH